VHPALQLEMEMVLVMEIQMQEMELELESLGLSLVNSRFCLSLSRRPAAQRWPFDKRQTTRRRQGHFPGKWGGEGGVRVLLRRQCDDI